MGSLPESSLKSFCGPDHRLALLDSIRSIPCLRIVDEGFFVNPQNIRLRKRALDANARKRASKGPSVEDRSGR